MHDLVLDLSDCGANACSGCIHGAGGPLGAAHVLPGTGEEVAQYYCFCYLPGLLNSAAVDLSGAVVTVVAGSSLLRPEASAVFWNESRFELQLVSNM